MHALKVTRVEDFPEWYQAVVREADLAELSPTRGSMIIKPWGMGMWERIRDELDRQIRETGHENYYFPLLIPLSFFAKEAEHVEGFAKEMAVVTHHRLKAIDGELKPDPDAELAEPLIIRPTSETIIGDAFSRWIKSYRDLPLKLNQWANVMRWEMRTRLFLRTAEFLWQEGHTAHADEADAREETMLALEIYRNIAEDFLAIPVVVGEKPENERFPGAVSTYSLEAMMQDGKALQAATSHYLGTNFAEAQNIRFQDKEGGQSLAHTTSWGMTTRMIGAAVMVHGDDDGMRTPPAVAPRQIVIVPMLRGKPEDAELKDYCAALAKELGGLAVFGSALRAYVDTKDAKPADKRWDWVRRGAPLICEIGPRDAANGQVTFIKRTALREGEKIKSHTLARADFVAQAAALLEATQRELYNDAKARLESNIRSDLVTFADLERYYGTGENEGEFKGWARVHWSRPTGAALEEVGTRLKALKLTIRNAPRAQPQSFGKCIFTGAAAVEEILIARAY
ncbi:MAG TPA: aminoacyl--tRNA ligase-related protein [Vitreimonas sp.]|uniref:aminoacyl--tRNA ligase-related protein n=1 Tax=Vitreimonas sp. TaxID=3069702 RepID=UPI002D524829|nr:aminoacyl--tRNA ligase-related protein [Vitreimonas sp.]HYD85868.1 aminoacyl--tRNA ligase-related protein [Vitreimonas sp.]